MNSNKQTISVIMPIYNCQDTLAKAIDSIIGQTYTDWELILCDDGSSDNTLQIAEQYKEKYPEKIVLIRNEVNQGLNFTLNKCFRASKGELIARQDADDISLPMRFEKQVNYLNENPDCAFVSCGFYVNDGKTRIGVRIQDEKKPKPEGFRSKNQFFHQTAMIRRKAFEAVGGYTEDPRLLRVEDYNLWTKLYAAGFSGENIQEPYYETLENDATYSRRKLKYRINGVYARFIAVDMLGLPKWYKLFAIRGLLLGLLPNSVYRFLHRKKLILLNKRYNQQHNTGGDF